MSKPSLNFRRSARSFESFSLSCFTHPRNVFNSPHTIWWSGGGAGVEEEAGGEMSSFPSLFKYAPAAPDALSIISINEEG